MIDNARTASSSRSTSGRLTHDQRATGEAGPAGYVLDRIRALAKADAAGLAASIARGDALYAARVEEAERRRLNLDRKPLGT